MTNIIFEGNSIIITIITIITITTITMTITAITINTITITTITMSSIIVTMIITTMIMTQVEWRLGSQVLAGPRPVPLSNGTLLIQVIWERGNLEENLMWLQYKSKTKADKEFSFRAASIKETPLTKELLKQNFD